MSRKVLKSMARDGQRRRSPRISALDCNENHQNRQLSKTRSGMKRKLDVSKLAKQVWKGRDSPQNEDNSTDIVEWRSIDESPIIKENQNYHAVAKGTPSVMPDKHILELVLDTLQRRDTYEIFAEPVDPDEVEDYYEIIKEPMDFGTMRAKLHEGMYENLQQLEHDVFLIPENAMHFNSSDTIYFKQARAIHELAKKVFHVLKTDPESFVSEFSGTRRRSMRKALSGSKDSRIAIAKPADIYTPRLSKKNHFHGRTFSNGRRDGRLSSVEVADRRLAYLYNDENSVDANFYSSCKALVLMNQGDISYKDSLMSYVKDLGSTAQMVAKRKLLGQHQSNKCRIVRTEKCPNLDNSIAKEFKTFRDFAPTSTNPFRNASKNVIIDLTKDRDEKEEEEEKADNNSKKGKEKVEMPTRVASANARNSSAVGKELSFSTSKGNDKARPVILALENSHSNAGDFKPRIKRNCIVSKPLVKIMEIAGDEARKDPEEEEEPSPLAVVSRFTFDLPFLKARLSQMNAVETGRKSRC